MPRSNTLTGGFDRFARGFQLFREALRSCRIAHRTARRHDILNITLYLFVALLTPLTRVRLG